MLESHLCRSRGTASVSCLSGAQRSIPAGVLAAERREDGVNIGDQPERGGSARGSQCHGAHPSLGTAPHFLIRVGNEFRRIAPCRVGMVWAGTSLAFHTPPLPGQGVPEIISAGWGEKKPAEQVMFQNTDFPRLICRPSFIGWRKNTKGKIVL